MSAFGVRAWGRALEQSRVRRAPAHRGGAVTRDVSEQGWSEKPTRHTAQAGLSEPRTGVQGGGWGGGVLSRVGTQSGEVHGTRHLFRVKEKAGFALQSRDWPGQGGVTRGTEAEGMGASLWLSTERQL